MKVIKITTRTPDNCINEIFDEIPKELKLNWSEYSELGKEQVLSFTDYRINSNLTLLLDLIKSSALSEVPEDKVIDVLKGKSYVKKTVTTEYFIIENDGEDITKKINDDYINYLTSDNPEELPEDKQFLQKGNEIITKEEYNKE